MLFSLMDQLRERFAAAIAEVTGLPVDQVDPVIRPTDEERFGDYQCNAAMSLARRLGVPPRELAGRIAARVRLDDLAGPLEVAGPGFINIRLSPAFLARCLGEVPPAPDGSGRLAGPPAWPGAQRGETTATGRPARGVIADRLGVPPTRDRRRVVVDYSSPNIAKQMHVGHLRSTIIGDVLARVLIFEGHEVIPQNHVGDWGTAMGMVILGLWYIEARRRRHHEADAVIEQRVQRLLALRAEPPSARLPLLTEICREWSEDLRDPSLDEPARSDVDLDALELGYRFIQALMAAAEGTEASVIGRDGAVERLVDIPRKITMHLQRGSPADQPERAAWARARQISLDYCQRIYERLGVLLTPEDVCGESFYQCPAADRGAGPAGRDRLSEVVAELVARLPPRAVPPPRAGPLAGDTSPSASSAPPGAAGRPEASGPAAPAGLRAPEQAWAEVREDQGALCIFFYDAQGRPQFLAPDGSELPMIIRKSDGAYLYATTDLAALRYRILELGARRVIYVTDARQKLHFQMLFAAARAAGWTDDDVQLDHVTFGSVLGPDGRPLRTREGANVRLSDLLDEAVRRARRLVDESEAARAAGADAGTVERPAAGPGSPEGETSDGIGPVRQAGAGGAETPGRETLSESERQRIAEAVGIGAVKYADLARERTSDYVFDWDRMLAMSGNTAPYMMYAYARIRSIYRKAAARLGDPDVYASDVRLLLEHPAERALGLRLARLRETIDSVASDLAPHVLCGYLYGLAVDFMRFYEQCPVIQAERPETRLSRLRLCDLTARTLRLGLSLLGITVLERM